MHEKQASINEHLIERVYMSQLCSLSAPVLLSKTWIHPLNIIIKEYNQFEQLSKCFKCLLSSINNHRHGSNTVVSTLVVNQREFLDKITSETQKLSLWHGFALKDKYPNFEVRLK